MSMSVARGHSVPGQSVPYRAERIPLTPRTNTLGPYGPQRLPGGGALQSGRANDSRRGPLNRSGATNPSVHERAVNSRAQQAANEGANGSGSPAAACQQQILDELRQGREEQRKFREDIKKMGHLITRLEEEYRKLNDQLKQQTDAAFTVETSGLKDDMNKELSLLFTRSLERQPSRQEIAQAIVKVFNQEAKNKKKFTKIRTFCYNRLTDFRCEERRRLFGIKPCQSFPALTTEEFADRFMSSIKAPDDHRDTYIKNLALLRKFARDCPDARSDTFKKFREWVHDKFTTGCPDDNDWAVIMDEDKECDYHLEHEGNTQDDSYGHYSGDGSRPSLEDDLGEQSISNGYNPAMDVFQLQS